MAQGRGWPALIRVMVHWFSKNERGTKMSIVSITQNISRGIIGPLTILGIIIFNSWQSIFYFPAMISLVVIIMILLLVRDTPQSEGLPPIGVEDKTNWHLESDIEREFTIKEIFFKCVFVNKKLWYLSLANMFVYLIRYGIINWTPTYLIEEKGFSFSTSSWAFFYMNI